MIIKIRIVFETRRNVNIEGQSGRRQLGRGRHETTSPRGKKYKMADDRFLNKTIEQDV